MGSELAPLLGGMGGRDNPGYEGPGGPGGLGGQAGEAVALKREMGLISGISLIVGEIRRCNICFGLCLAYLQGPLWARVSGRPPVA